MQNKTAKQLNFMFKKMENYYNVFTIVRQQEVNCM